MSKVLGLGYKKGNESPHFFKKARLEVMRLKKRKVGLPLPLF